jgi:hypothetical protein
VTDTEATTTALVLPESRCVIACTINAHTSTHALVGFFSNHSAMKVVNDDDAWHNAAFQVDFSKFNILNQLLKHFSFQMLGNILEATKERVIKLIRRFASQVARDHASKMPSAEDPSFLAKFRGAMEHYDEELYVR